MINNSSNFRLDNTNRNLGIFTDSLATVSSGTDNIAIGAEASEALTTGTKTIAIGYQALNLNNGTENVAIGYEAGKLATGTYNTFVGSSTGCSGVSGLNTFIGSNVGNLTSPFIETTAVGYGAGAFTAKSIYDVCIGARAVTGVAGGGESSANVFIGHESGKNFGGGSANVYVGREAGYVVTAGISGSTLSNVGIGFEALGNSPNGQYNVGIGSNAGTGLTGIGCTYVGQAAGSQEVGNYNTGIGYQTGINGSGFSNCTSLGYSAKSNASNRVWLGDGAATVYVTNGQVYDKSSQRNTKKDITSLDEDTVDFIMSLDPVMFKYKDEVIPAVVDAEGNILSAERTIPHNRYHTGFIAEDVAELIADKEIDFAFYVDPSIDEPGSSASKTIGKGELIAPLVKCVQSLQAQITELQERINNLSV